MFKEIFRFELRYQLRQPLFWLSAFFVFLLTFLAVTTDAVVVGGGIGNVNRNAPYVIMQIMLVMSVMGVFVTTAFVAGTVLRDAEHRTQEVFFTTTMRKRDYLLGRFAGALVAAFGIFLSVALGIMLGSIMPWLEPERIGPFTWAPYFFSMLVLVLPNLLLTGSVFFSLATLTRSMMYTYAGVVALFFGYFLAGNLLSDMENEPLAAVLDPFGSGALEIATKYWTVAERNSQVLAFEEPMLTNRLVWLGVALVIFALTYTRFSFTITETRRARQRRKELEAGATQEGAGGLGFAQMATSVAQVFTWSTTLQQFLRQTRMEVGSVARSIAFPVIVGFGVLNIIGNSSVIDVFVGTPVYPVTHLMINILQSSSLFIYIILTFYSGELVWRERSYNLNEVHDALPLPNWVLWSSKLIALIFILLAMLATAVITGIGIQTYRGYYNFEPDLYLRGMFLVVGVTLVLGAVLALFLQVMANQKYVGFLLMIAFLISGPALSALDFDHNLYRYGSAPGVPYSDMNGYGHFVRPLTWFYLYWSFCAALLVVLTHLFWVRGVEERFRLRLRLARQRFTRPVAAMGAVAAFAFVATGAYIFYNTNVLNEYIPGDVQEERQARFEKSYKQYESLPQPRITSVYADVDIYPERRDVDIRGRYTLRNKTGEPIGELHMVIDPRLNIRDVSIPGARLSMEDSELGYFVHDLDTAIQPGEELELRFDLAVETRGFVNNASNTSVLANGTFFNNFQYFPRIGYTRAFELQNPNDRRKHGLPPIQRMPNIDDAKARFNNYISSESDWIEFETVVSTSSDQIALAPGYLQREWQEGTRRYFHYKMDAPILGFFSYLSANWEVARDRWGDVAIEIYYHRGHPYNVQRMIDAVKKSLDYFSTHFSPYQHRQVRILEFPRYARFAQSFPNTIPFSESIGFIAKLDEEDDEGEGPIDYVFYVTAHEVAHQWWAHQVIGGFVQGATVMSESLAQYSALMVMEKEYGHEKMRRFLKYELDNYLRSRGGELIEELPLLFVENQPYIHYRKGSLVTYALKDYIGEEVLNAALARYIHDVGFQEPPYTYSREFLSYIREAVANEQVSLLEDLFETITLYDNRAAEATYEETDDGKYRVKLAVESKKLRAGGEGEETEIPIDDFIDVAVFGSKEPGGPAEGKLLSLEKRKVDERLPVFEIVVDEKPVRAGIDPFNKLIDRNPEDNVTTVQAGTMN